MSRQPQITVRLGKEDFKFAAAHFTLFPDAPAERLHGHNYQVRVELTGSEPGPDGLLAPVAEIKAEIRALCESLDEHTLIPEKSPQLEVERQEGSVCITLGSRRYVLPSDEIRLLPLPNVTMELLAAYLWEALVPAVRGGRVHTLSVEVQETSGQSCRYRAELPSS